MTVGTGAEVGVVPEEAPPRAHALHDAHVVVLGASSGIGRACALRAAEEGAAVLGVHLDTAAREDAVADLDRGLRARAADVRLVNANAAAEQTRRDVVQLLAAGVPARPRTVLLHSLAFGSLLPFVAPPGEDGDLLSPRQMTMTLEVMAHSLVWWVRDLLAAGLLPPGSHVVAMTSAGDARVSPSYGAVSAAKSALLSHVRQLAVELAPYGVAVNALRAGVTRTPAFARIPGSDAIAAAAVARNPHGRLTEPRDVADAFTGLVAARTSWVTGNVLGVDGGEVLTG